MNARIGAARPADWTVLVLLNGNNDLQPSLTRDLIDLESVGSSDSVRVVAQLTRGPGSKGEKGRLDGDWDGTRRYEVNRAPGPGRKRTLKSAVLEELPNQNHGDPSTLRDFLRWGMEKYPARHYAVVVGDHGKGFLGTGFDDVHRDTLRLPELREALSQSGLKPDVLVLDACLMGQLEVASELQDRAGYLVASEEILGRDGLPHADLLGWLAAHPEGSGRELSQALVDLSENDQIDRMEADQSDEAVQLSALDLSQVAGLEKACDRLAGLLLEERVPRATLKRLIGRTQRFNGQSRARPEQDFRDLGNFVDRLMESPRVTDPQVRRAARQVRSSLAEVVVRQQNAGDDVEQATGLSVYLPTRYGREAKPRGTPRSEFEPTWGYQRTSFAAGTRWDEMLSWLSAG